MLERLRRTWTRNEEAVERRVDLLERRLTELESRLEGLQDSVHREATRRDGQLARLEKKTEPSAVARALNENARRRGL